LAGQLTIRNIYVSAVIRDLLRTACCFTYKQRQPFPCEVDVECVQPARHLRYRHFLPRHAAIPSSQSTEYLDATRWRIVSWNINEQVTHRG